MNTNHDQELIVSRFSSWTQLLDLCPFYSAHPVRPYVLFAIVIINCRCLPWPFAYLIVPIAAVSIMNALSLWQTIPGPNHDDGRTVDSRSGDRNMVQSANANPISVSLSPPVASVVVSVVWINAEQYLRFPLDFICWWWNRSPQKPPSTRSQILQSTKPRSKWISLRGDFLIENW